MAYNSMKSTYLRRCFKLKEHKKGSSPTELKKNPKEYLLSVKLIY